MLGEAADGSDDRMGEFAFRGDGEDLFAHRVDAADDLHRVLPVSSSPRPTRRKSATPSVDSNSLNCPLIDCGVRCGCSLARAMLPALATIQK
jgi:hypothetical protein